MSKQMDLLDKSFIQFDEFEKSLNGHKQGEIHLQRKNAISALRNLGFPTRKTENYKYTPITNRLKKEFTLDFLALDAWTISKEAFNNLVIPNLDAINVVLINGRLSAELSDLNEFDNQVEILDFQYAYKTRPEMLDLHFGKYANHRDDAFTALNTAFANFGVVIKVADHQVIEKPVVIYSISNDHADNFANQPRNLVILGKNSQLKLIEEFVHLGENAIFTNTVTEIAVHKDAVLDYYKFQIKNKNAVHVGNTHITQIASSLVNTCTITLAGRLIRNNLNIVLDDEHCESHMYGLYILNDEQHVDNQTMVDHKKPNSYSNELYKGILNDHATGVFNGKIYVRPDAQKTNAFQSNKNIILSQNAQMNTKPQLEIWADDVKCSHGATTGQLDKEQMFYLRSRGLGKEQARSILLNAFAIEVIENIKIEALKTYVEHNIGEVLKNEN